MNNKFLAFLKANRPERIEIAAPEMVQGIAVEFSKNSRVIFRQWINGREHFDLVCRTPLSVWWKEEVKDAEIVFTPILDWSEASMSFEKKAEISKLILSHLGILEKVVKLLEKVVYLPVPSWVGAECCNGCVNSASPYSIPCFASEARRTTAEFKKELGKVEEELK